MTKVHDHDFPRNLRRALAAHVVFLALASGCTSDHFTPRVVQIDHRPLSTQMAENRALPPDRLRRVVVIVMLPAYGSVEQIRRGNMGHAAIEVGGRFFDMGALNGYAYVFRATPAVRFWNFPDAGAALAAIANQTDCDGHQDRIVRFDATLTDEQAARLWIWWQQMESRMLADDHNQLYFWSDWQCASSVACSLRDAGVMSNAAQNPQELADGLAKNLRHTAGEHAGELAEMTVVQPGIAAPSGPSAISQTATLVFRFPRLFAAGERSALTLESPDGASETILWSDSTEYEHRVATFRVTPRDAVRLSLGAGPAWGAQALPNFVVGQWYHIATDHIIGQAAVRGWYVNGKTGEVVRIEDARVIRFDTFAGDRVVEGDKK